MALKKTLRVLAVDDEPFMLELYRNALENMNAEVLAFRVEYDVCRTGENAVVKVEKAVQGGRPYAVIFLA